MQPFLPFQDETGHVSHPLNHYSADIETDRDVSNKDVVLTFKMRIDKDRSLTIAHVEDVSQSKQLDTAGNALMSRSNGPHLMDDRTYRNHKYMSSNNKGPPQKAERTKVRRQTVQQS